MTHAEYLAAFAAMGINPRSKSAAELIGMSHRMTIYYADGAFIPLPIQKLVVLLLDRFNRGDPPWPENTTQ